MGDPAAVVREHGYQSLTVARIVQETADTRTFVFAIPPELRERFAYHAGQFCTVRIHVGDDEVLRCYSMSSAPATDSELAVTVKRVPGGVMSNWLHDHVAEGDRLELMRPTGLFGPVGTDGPIVAFCGGSGVTPVFSIVKQALATGSRPLRVLYANRDEASVIFGADFDRLAADHPERLAVRHHLDAQAGFLSPTDIAAFVGPDTAADFLVCGPTPFMDVVEAGLALAGVDPARISIERFANDNVLAEPASTDDGGPSAVDGDATETLSITLRGKTVTFAYKPGDTVLDAARRAGLKPPFSCELGNCASCMALVHEGGATMRANHALTPDEVAEGWILTCQAVPRGRSVVVEYEDL